MGQLWNPTENWVIDLGYSTFSEAIFVGLGLWSVTAEGKSPDMSSTGLILINLGSPDTPRKPEVRRYLDEFLMDEGASSTSTSCCVTCWSAASFSTLDRRSLRKPTARYGPMRVRR